MGGGVPFLRRRHPEEPERNTHFTHIPAFLTRFAPLWDNKNSIPRLKKVVKRKMQKNVKKVTKITKNRRYGSNEK
jgi:hypothetical protein